MLVHRPPARNICTPLGLALIAVHVVLVTAQASGKTDLLKRVCHKSYYTWPKCIDYPDGYGCECGPGFVWNTKMCISLGVDSRLSFEAATPVRYTLLLGKSFPRLRSFTIALWLRVDVPHWHGTILSYKHGDRKNLIRVMSGPTIGLHIHDEPHVTDASLNVTTWTHLTYTWTSENGYWALYINGNHIRNGVSTKLGTIPPGGELVLGQSSRSHQTPNYFPKENAFIGDMAFVNIWHRAMNKSEVAEIFKDCIFMQCGDAVEWADFRSGTRGLMRMIWPSEIPGERLCYSDEEAAYTCDKWCSEVIGAQCKSETVENIVWERTRADQNISVPCPGSAFSPGDNTAYANRSCLRKSESQGMWGEPELEDCIWSPLLDLKTEIKEFTSSENMDGYEILRLAEHVMNLTSTQRFSTPIDLSSVIDCLDMLVTAQVKVMSHVTRHREQYNKESGENAQVNKFYPSMEETELFSKLVVGTVDRLLEEKNAGAWKGVQPPGAEGDDVMKLVKTYNKLIYRSLKRHVTRGDVTPSNAFISALGNNIAIKIRLYKMSQIAGVAFPDHSDLYTMQITDEHGTIALPREALLELSLDKNEYIGVSTARYKMAAMLPNHNASHPKKSKDDNVNSRLFSMHIHLDTRRERLLGQRLHNLTYPVTMYLPYLDNFNISNPECVVLVHGNRSHKWQWTREGCNLSTNATGHATCMCSRPGVFAVITDMYNVNWDRGDRPPILMEVPSYVGCSVSSLLCLISFIMLIYHRTSSKTSSLHKQFAIAVTFSQLTFMFGINRYDKPVMCHVFAIMLHYFFLAAFSWLMNEAFNLYIVITYAAHSHGDHAEGGSQLRYYILGWVLPGVLVGAFVGTHTDDYYAPDMCWIAWEYVWLFLGPVLGILCVIVLVLIFAAKEHHESSYSKNEKTIKIITIHNRALWTQAILLSICWAFAFLSIKMSGVIIKYLYCMFNCLQGAFFIVFYFLLNDEVRSVYLAQRKRKTLAKQDYEYSPTNSLCSVTSAEDTQEEQEAGPSSTAVEFKLKKQRHKKKKRSQIEASSDEDSDGDVMVTSV